MAERLVTEASSREARRAATGRKWRPAPIPGGGFTENGIPPGWCCPIRLSAARESRRPLGFEGLRLDRWLQRHDEPILQRPPVPSSCWRHRLRQSEFGHKFASPRATSSLAGPAGTEHVRRPSPSDPSPSSEPAPARCFGFARIVLTEITQGLVGVGAGRRRSYKEARSVGTSSAILRSSSMPGALNTMFGLTLSFSQKAVLDWIMILACV